jgi:hypothetical protein
MARQMPPWMLESFAGTPGKLSTAARPLSRSTFMADTIKQKVQDAGQAAKDAAAKAGEKIKEGADAAASKTADAAKNAGQAVKDAGQKLKDKSGA